jgi:Mini-chromosome maintenance replisome factor
MLQMEMFAAIYPNASSSSQEPILKSNFFSETNTDSLDELNHDRSVFYERTPALLQIQQSMFNTKNKRVLSLAEIYAMQHSKFKDLNDKLVNSEFQAPFVVKIYGSEEQQREDGIQINSFVEIIGFLYSSHPVESESATEPLNMNGAEMGLEAFEIDHYLNNYFAPSIHALSVTKLSPYDNQFEEYADLSAPTADVVQSMKGYFRKACYGDEVVADLVFYSMLSYVTGRPQQYAIDCLCLNVYDVRHPQVIENIINLLNLFTPYFITQDVTLKDMGCTKWYGKKNYVLNCIENGKLHTPNGSLIFLNESSLESGKIHEVGVKNAAFITGIIENQKAYYDFDYFSFSAESNLTVISFSQGKSIFGFEYRVSQLVTIDSYESDQ